MLRVPLFLFALSFTLFALQSGDAIMYLNLAKDFVLNPAWPTTDPYVYSLDHAPLVWTHEYLSFLIFYGAYLLFGIPGMILLKSLVWDAIFYIPLQAAPRTMNASKLFVALWILAVMAASFRFIERSSLFSDFALVFLTAYLLPKDSLKPKNLILLSLFFTLWAQLHPAFPLGFGIFAIWACHRIFIQKSIPLKQTPWLLLPILATMIHPNGVEALIYPIRFGFFEAAVFKKYNYEWLPSYHPLFRSTPETISYWILLGLTAFLFLRERNWRDLRWWLAAFFIAVGISAVRFIPWTSFALLIVLKPSLELKKIKTHLSPVATAILAVLLAAISIKNVFFGYMSSSGERLPRLVLDPKFFPDRSVDFLLKSPIPGRLYNSHDFGAYLVWRGYRPIFHHGFMTDMDFYENDVIGVFRSQKRFLELAAKYNWTMLLVEKNSNFRYFYAILKDLPEWKVVAQDEASFLIYRLPD